MKANLLAIIALSLAGLPNLAPAPTLNLGNSLTASLGTNSLSLSVNPPPPATNAYYLTWDYPYDTSNIVFEVWHAQELSTPAPGAAASSWTLLTNLPGPPLQLDTQTAPMGFFMVRASNTVSGLVSDWAH